MGLPKQTNSYQSTPVPAQSISVPCDPIVQIMLWHKSHSGTFKTKESGGGLVRVRLFWKSHFRTRQSGCSRKISRTLQLICLKVFLKSIVWSTSSSINHSGKILIWLFSLVDGSWLTSPASYLWYQFYFTYICCFSTWGCTHIQNTFIFLWSQSHDWEHGRSPLQHIVPCKVFWGGS